MTLAETLTLVHQRGLSIVVEGGKPKLLGPAEARTPELLAALRDFRQQIIARFTPPMPRRIVLLVDGRDSLVQAVLEEPEAIGCTRRARELAEQHRGRTLAVEWQSKLGWVRYFWISMPQEQGSAETTKAVA